MAEECIRERWNHTSSLLAMLANANRDPKKGRALRPADFHPMQQAAVAKAPVLKGDLGMLKSVFVDNHGVDQLCGNTSSSTSS
jgi:hypothetical protein